MERLHADIKNQRLVARPVLYTVMQNSVEIKRDIKRCRTKFRGTDKKSLA